jgi:hypothetical protein
MVKFDQEALIFFEFPIVELTIFLNRHVLVWYELGSQIFFKRKLIYRAPICAQTFIFSAWNFFAKIFLVYKV